MDPFFQAQIYQCPYYPSPPPRLTPYQATPFMTNPGAGTSNFVSTPMVPTYGENLYSQTKDNAEPSVTKLENKVQAPMSDNVDIQNAQQGFGVVKEERTEKEESSNESDMNTDSLQKMDQSVLQAFQSPVIKTSSFNFEPKKRKANVELTNSQEPKIKKKLKGKIKFV